MIQSSSKKFQQPWFHGPIVDTIGMFGFPLIILISIILFNDNIGNENLLILVGMISFIDYGHSWLSWVRVASNPLETKKNTLFYLGSGFIFFIILSILFYNSQIKFIHHFLVYFAIVHFIRQQFGIIKIYSKTDGLKSKFQLKATDTFIYLTMLYPIIWWHNNNGNVRLYWKEYLIDIPYISTIEIIARFAFMISFLIYVYYEYKISVKNKGMNIPKNLTILTTILSWVYSIMYSSFFVTFMFGVIYSHNISYFIIIWSTARRDYLLQGHSFSVSKLRNILNWKSYEGFFTYFLSMNFIAASVLAIYHWMGHERVIQVLHFNIDFSWLPSFTDKRTLGFAIVSGLYFSTHANHYFIDTFLWKKEKDYAWSLKKKESL